MKEINAILLGFVLLLVAGFGAYQLGWIIKEDSVNRNAEINRGSFEFQQSLRDEIVDQSADLARLDTQIEQATDDQRPVLVAQRNAMREQLCSLAADLTGELSAVHVSIIGKEC